MTIVSATERAIGIGEPDNFTGQVLLDALTQPEGASLLSSNSVSFTPGARSVWHEHVNRQVLIVTAGWGVLQFRGQPAQRLAPGDVATIPADSEHWHGAAPDSSMTHLALIEAEGDGTTWLEPVNDGDYRAAAASLSGPAA